MYTTFFFLAIIIIAAECANELDMPYTLRHNYMTCEKGPEQCYSQALENIFANYLSIGITQRCMDWLFDLNHYSAYTHYYPLRLMSYNISAVVNWRNEYRQMMPNYKKFREACRVLFTEQ